MKALFLSHLDPAWMKGGAERYVATLTQALKDLADVDFATKKDVASLRLDDYDVIHVGAPEPRLVELARKARRAKIAVTFYGAPLGLARHGWQTGRGGIYRLGQLAVYGRDLFETSMVMNRVDAVVPISRCTADDLVKQFPPVRRKLFLNECGVDVDHFTADGAGDDGYVLFVGRLERSKGVDSLVRALSGGPHRLVVAGTGSLAGELRGMAGPNVEFRGEVPEEELLTLYRRASVCVFPSLFEGYGLVAVEALACGTPTAVSDAFCVRGPAAGLLEWFPVGDEAAMRAAVDRLWGKKTPEWSARAYAVVRDHHSVGAQAKGLLGLYESLAQGRGVPRE